MTYPCGIIRDLLPLYIDDVCNEESKQAVENHLSECEKCRNYYESMKSTEGFVAKGNDNSEDMKMANNLKNVKSKINKKIRNIVLGAVAAMVFVIVGVTLLFNVALKEVSPDDVIVSANVYSFEELIENPASNVPNSESVTIYSDDSDNSQKIEVRIPEIGEITVTEDTIEKNKYVTVFSVSSEYFIRTIKHEIKGDTIYISAFKTTLLNNKAESYQKTMTSLQFSEINRIVYVEDDGKETVLWSK
ncbi:MAG: zf-HC2 domain-containing protein [Lachnospiraceae bacterium]|nr:zf-HC2 domain-containing protein [Lachnospiraceae bacterium]